MLNDDAVEDGAWLARYSLFTLNLKTSKLFFLLFYWYYILSFIMFYILMHCLRLGKTEGCVRLYWLKPYGVLPCMTPIACCAFTALPPTQCDLVNNRTPHRVVHVGHFTAISRLYSVSVRATDFPKPAAGRLLFLVFPPRLVHFQNHV